jgi:hypothetical protein
MATLTPGVVINPGDVVTRQTLYDLVANATIGGSVQASDLAADVKAITSQSLAPSNPIPGLLWFDQTEQVLKVWTDCIENTACSVWLAVGPDAFDVALYATEPIPYGAAVVAALGAGGRAAALPTNPGGQGAAGYTLTRFENLRFMGVNQSVSPTLGPCNHNTAASGTWFASRIYGHAYGWAPGQRGASANHFGVGLGFGNALCFLSGASLLSNPSGVSNLLGAVCDCGSGWAGAFTGASWGIALERNCPAPGAAVVTRDQYARILIGGPRFKAVT